MIRELDTVVLIYDVEERGLEEGGVGVVVDCYENGEAFEVEFVTAEGKTIALLTLDKFDICAMSNDEILHVRTFEPF